MLNTFIRIYFFCAGGQNLSLLMNYGDEKLHTQIFLKYMLLLFIIR